MSKSNGPGKPQSKAVARLVEQLERRRGVRDLEKRFLIVCEDGKSAPNYFNALKKHFNLSAASIRVAGSEGHTQPLQVVERAVDINASAAAKDSSTEPFDQVWCVIDGDFGAKIANARSKANAHGVLLAISNKCFEYWILLHFEENDKAAADCNGLVKTLRKKHLPKYEKGKCEFEPIVPKVREACARAEKLRKPGIARGDLPEVQNPCSEVYLLINAILGAMPKP